MRPMNRWNYERICPGVTGSVGDVNMQVRLKQSAPDMPMRYSPYFSHGNEVFLGSNVQNGDSRSYCSGGAGATVIDSNWGGRRGFKTRHGWICQDLRAPDTLHEPRTGSTPQYSWNNKIATTYKAMRSGNMFLPAPYMLPRGAVPRGGQVPRIIDKEIEETPDVVLTTQTGGSNFTPSLRRQPQMAGAMRQQGSGPAVGRGGKNV